MFEEESLAHKRQRLHCKVQYIQDVMQKTVYPEDHNKHLNTIFRKNC